MRIVAIWFLSFFVAHSALADYSIEPLGDGLYRFVDDRHRAVFLVTDEGIVLVDTLNSRAAAWLKTELDKRFDVPVRYVIYSHNHSDHIYGAEAFDAPGVTFIAHRLAAQDIQITKTKTVAPDISFSDQLALDVGGQRILLRYHGPNDGRGSVSIEFKRQRTLFVVDWIVLNRMPWRKLWSYDIQGMINSTRDVLALDFDTFVGGHADIGTKAEIVHYLGYLEALYELVVSGIQAGKTLPEIQQQAQLAPYAELPHYDAWLADNIEGVYERLMEESGMGWRPDL